MSKLKCIQLDPDTVIWVEAEEKVDDSGVSSASAIERAATDPLWEPSIPANSSGTSVTQRQAKGLRDALGLSVPDLVASGGSALATRTASPGLDQTIKSYTQYDLRAFRDAALSEVRKVTLEFGVNLSGMSGIPYIATGTAGCNIKVTVECEFPKPEIKQS